MILQAAMGAGIGILVFGVVAFLIFTPLMSVFAYSAICWCIEKINPSIKELSGMRKIFAITGSVILGMVFACLLICFAFWLLFKDVTFD